MMYGYGNGMNGGGYVLMIAGLVVLVGLVATGVLLIVRSGPAVRRPVSDLERGHEAERILEQRFARGEIEQDEFLSRMDVLRRAVKP
jgi:putative membrane protein